MSNIKYEYKWYEIAKKELEAISIPREYRLIVKRNGVIQYIDRRDLQDSVSITQAD